MFLPVVHDLCSQNGHQLHIISAKCGLGVSRNNTIRRDILQVMFFEKEDEMKEEDGAKCSFLKITWLGICI